jgi:hypothetical protein
MYESRGLEVSKNVSAGLCWTVPRFCVKAEKHPKQYINEKNQILLKKFSNFSMGANFPHFIGKK